MCTAHTIIAYAISVSTASLLEAADAFPHLAPTLPVFQLISLRLREGRLQASAKDALSKASAVQYLPLEVWECIKREVISLELAEARRALIEPLFCDECYLLRNDELKQGGWGDLLQDACEYCLARASEFEGLRDNERQKRVRKLLNFYKLALPTSFPVRASKDVSSSPFFFSRCDPTTATFISIPLPEKPAKNGCIALEAECGGDSAADEQVIVDLNPVAELAKSYRNSKTLNDRFRTVVDLFQLQVIEASDGVLAIEGTTVPEGNKKKVLKKRRFKRVNVKDIKPKWKLFTTCETTW
ncbi:hypothetical protein JCM11251_004135 [Rhodosporidiobolus azoricus]